MRFHSPWRWPFAGPGLQVVRRLLRPFGQSEQRLLRWLVEVNNARVRRHLHRQRIESVLLIMPRCLKLSGCRVSVRTELDGRPPAWDEERPDLAECTGCVDCDLGRVAELARHYRVRTLVATRSHVAYALARRCRPDLIIATACEDRLLKALRSVPEIPALLNPLTAMERPCVNAHSDLVWLERQLEAVLRTGRVFTPTADSKPETAAAENRAATSADG